MPMQQQMSSFAARLGGRVAQANAEHRDKPVDTGNRRLPAGIRSGVAKLSSMYTKQQTEDGGKTPKGEVFFRASAIVMSPEHHNGEKTAGLLTSVIIPLCDVPAKGQRKAESFSDNWYEFQNLFKLLGIAAPTETPQTDPTGQRTEAYYLAAMKTLTDPKRPPVYIEFSTRGWTPPATTAQPRPEEMVFETWHGLASAELVARIGGANGQHNPVAGVSVAPVLTQPTFNEFDPPPAAAPAPVQAPTADGDTGADNTDLADRVAVLVETAMNDPEGATEEGTAASSELEKLAWANGWSKDQTANAADWVQVGDMALSTPQATTTQLAPVTGANAAVPVLVGGKWKFCKRTKEGAKLKNNKGEEFPPQEVEVTTVDAVAKTCTVKAVKDGKDVVDIRTKKPVAVKWEWLE